MHQVVGLHSQFDELQKIHGDSSLSPIYGAGDIRGPRVMFIFMNPTARNISSRPSWDGLRAPWIGTKLVWGLFREVGLLDEWIFHQIVSYRPEQWTRAFAQQVYEDLEKRSVYITNLAKCTQVDSRPLPDRVYRDYVALMYQEIETVNPKKIVSFGNQVSSLLLNKKVRVGDYSDDSYEQLLLNRSFNVYPTYYPVGQGRRNQPAAIERINSII